MLLVFALLAALFSPTTTPAHAADYPLPTDAFGSVSSSAVRAGECTDFSGVGFRPNTPITIRDDGKVVGQTKADANGHFTYRVCFSTSSRLGRHTLTATGTGANGEVRVVTAFVTVLGASLTGSGGGPASGPSGGGGNGLPFTGSNVRDLSLFGLLLVVAGAMLTIRGHKSRGRRRLARATA